MDQKNVLFTNKKEKWDFVIAITVILLVGFFIYNKVFNNPEDLEKKQSAETEIHVEDLYDNEAENIFLEKEQLEKVADHDVSEKEASFYKINVEDKIEDEKGIMPIKPIIEPGFLTHRNREIEHSKIIEKSNIEKQEEVFENEITTENDTSIELDDTKLEEVEEENNNLTVVEKTTPEEVEVEKIEEAVIKKKEVIKNNGIADCTIVVGAFEEESNKTKIVKKLITLGYSYDEGLLTNGWTYVGVPVMCNDRKEEMRLISKLNNAFNVQAWVKRK